MSARALAGTDENLTLPQLRTLVVLEGNPSTAMGMLEAAGPAGRKADPAMRREVTVRLTERGPSLVGEVMGRRARWWRSCRGRPRASARGCRPACGHWPPAPTSLGLTVKGARWPTTGEAGDRLPFG
ncbi:hypothetical protein ACH427_08860 [Streptomyces sp. NPDC020379]|uniref:hypothetical protein n=1 Tax=Streptomyces sp. NPDC020379 TaxID=3365071 RepID=UPI0037B35D21